MFDIEKSLRQGLGSINEAEYRKKTKQSWFQVVDKKIGIELDVLLAKNKDDAFRKFMKTKKHLVSKGQVVTIYPVEWR